MKALPGKGGAGVHVIWRLSALQAMLVVRNVGGKTAASMNCAVVWLVSIVVLNLAMNGAFTVTLVAYRAGVTETTVGPVWAVTVTARTIKPNPTIKAATAFLPVR